VILTHAILAAIAAITLGAAWLEPGLFSAWMQEDAWAEWATFTGFAVAGGLFSSRALRSRDLVERVAVVALAAFCFFVAGEEISWGQRLIGFKPPDVFLEKNFQQESNLHNLLKEILDTRWMVLAVAALYALAVPVAMKWPRLSAFAPAARFVPWLLLVAAIELVYPWDLAGELAEMLLGLVFLGDASHRAIEPIEQGTRLGLAFQGAAIGVALVLVPLTDALKGRGGEEGRAKAHAELEVLSRDLSRNDAPRKKLWKKRRVHKRVFTAVKSRYMRFGTEGEFLERQRTPAEKGEGEARHDARGYFLDPWNQPYWILSHRLAPGRLRVLLYSFGPNRRRDTDVELIAGTSTTSSMLAGDDVGILFEIDRMDDARSER
jgi:hypothetical protein